MQRTIHRREFKRRETIREHFFQVIDKHLEARKDVSLDPITELPMYVVNMLQDCLTIVQRGNSKATFADVLRVERSASGRSDYHRKLALYMAELACESA